MFAILILAIVVGAIVYETLRTQPETGPDLSHLLRIVEDGTARLRALPPLPMTNTLPTWITRDDIPAGMPATNPLTLGRAVTALRYT